MSKSIAEIVDSIANKYAEERKELFLEQLEIVGILQDNCSPIEYLMANGLLFGLRSSAHLEGEGGDNRFIERRHIQSFEKTDFSWSVPYGAHIYPQMRIGKYTADFLVNLKHDRGGEVRGVIECDGHDYHERTKSQAQHDKERDRYFQSLGLIVLRYTGAEIYRDPIKCATDALEILLRRAEIMTRRRLK